MTSRAKISLVSFTTFAFVRGKSSAKQNTTAKRRSVSDARLVFSVDSRRGRAQASSITSGIPGETASDSYRVVKLTFPMPRGEWDGIEGVAVVVGAGDLLGDWDPLHGAELHKVIRSDDRPDGCEIWSGFVALPEAAVGDFKVVVRRADRVDLWSPGPDLVLPPLDSLYIPDGAEDCNDTSSYASMSTLTNDGTFHSNAVSAPALKSKIISVDHVLRGEEVLATVVFRATSKLEVGESLALVGSLPELGGWNTERIIPMTWTEGGVWTAAALFDAFSVFGALDENSAAAWVDFKLVKVDHRNGTSNIICESEKLRVKRLTDARAPLHAWLSNENFAADVGLACGDPNGVIPTEEDSSWIETVSVEIIGAGCGPENSGAVLPLSEVSMVLNHARSQAAVHQYNTDATQKTGANSSKDTAPIIFSLDENGNLMPWVDHQPPTGATASETVDAPEGGSDPERPPTSPPAPKNELSAAVAGERFVNANPRLISFAVNKRLNVGEKLLAVGNIIELGGWNAESGLEMTWSPGDNWTAFVEVDPDQAIFTGERNTNSIEFKLVTVDESSGWLAWPDGSNYVCTLNAPGCCYDFGVGVRVTMTEAVPSKIVDLHASRQEFHGEISSGMIEADLIAAEVESLVDNMQSHDASEFTVYDIDLSEEVMLMRAAQARFDDATATAADAVMAADAAVEKLKATDKDDVVAYAQAQKQVKNSSATAFKSVERAKEVKNEVVTATEAVAMLAKREAEAAFQAFKNAEIEGVDGTIIKKKKADADAASLTAVTTAEHNAVMRKYEFPEFDVPQLPELTDSEKRAATGAIIGSLGVAGLVADADLANALVNIGGEAAMTSAMMFLIANNLVFKKDRDRFAKSFDSRADFEQFWLSGRGFGKDSFASEVFDDTFRGSFDPLGLEAVETGTLFRALKKQERGITKQKCEDQADAAVADKSAMEEFGEDEADARAPESSTVSILGKAFNSLGSSVVSEETDLVTIEGALDFGDKKVQEVNTKSGVSGKREEGLEPPVATTPFTEELLPLTAIDDPGSTVTFNFETNAPSAKLTSEENEIDYTPEFVREISAGSGADDEVFDEQWLRAHEENKANSVLKRYMSPGGSDTVAYTSWMQKNKDNLSTLSWKELAERMKEGESGESSKRTR